MQENCLENGFPRNKIFMPGKKFVVGRNWEGKIKEKSKTIDGM